MVTKTSKSWYIMSMTFIDSLLAIKGTDLLDLLKRIQVVTVSNFPDVKASSPDIYLGIQSDAAGRHTLISRTQKTELESDADWLYRQGIDDIIYLAYRQDSDTMLMAWDTLSEKGSAKLDRAGHLSTITRRTRPDPLQLPSVQDIRVARQQLALATTQKKRAA
jgi:hypothetical protein